MTTTPRSTPSGQPELPSGRVVLEPPPPVQPHEGAGGLLANSIPMMGSLGSIAVLATMDDATGSRSLVAAGAFLLASLGFLAVQVDRQHQQRAQRLTASRTEYLHYLGGVRRLAQEAAVAQRRALAWRDPDPGSLPALAAEGSRVWERDCSHPRFLQVRYGVRRQPLALELVPPPTRPTGRVDPVTATALHRLLTLHRSQPDLPAVLDLRAFDRIEICGSSGRRRALARAMICSATAFHSPEHLVVAVLCGPRDLPHWDWLKWLPHVLSGRERDAVGPRRMVSTSLADLAALLPADLADRARFGAQGPAPAPHLLLVLDGAEPGAESSVVAPDGLHGVTVVDLAAGREPLTSGSRLRLELGPGPDDTNDAAQARVHRPELAALRLHEQPVRAGADQCDLATAEAFARRLAPRRRPVTSTGTAGRGADLAGPADIAELLGLGHGGDLDPVAAWQPRSARDRLRVPIGLAEDGGVVHLDLKESAQHGMGPHGLVVGATGSGKSELLRTLVLGLAATHSPEQLNLVLVDFKGGATFAGMAGLPHVSALITNLQEELTLVDRMQDALSGEMVRRQELLRSSGGYASVSDYERARMAGRDLPPLPALVIVVDEFSEMLAERPGFIDLFVAVGRLGRSLGLHLLLASQRLEEGRLRGLEAHLSYRIGLRTFSAQESRAVLGVPDAYELPAVPGIGYLKAGPHTLVAFRAAHVSGVPAGRGPVPSQESGQAPGILPFTVAKVVQPHLPARPRPASAEEAEPTGPSILDRAVAAMAGRGPAAHQVWLPPLDLPQTLDEVLGDLTDDRRLGLMAPRWRAASGLVVPLGTLDRPREQRRQTLTADLGGAAGHVAVVGGPRSGKSTLLRTLVVSTALVTTPLESQVFVLDFGGGTFAPLRRLPHVAGVGTRSEPDVVRRVLAEVDGILDRREAYFRAHGIDSVEAYRLRRGRGEVDDGWGDVFLVVDGWGGLRADFADLEGRVQQLAGRGLTYGVHVLAAAHRWADFRSAMRDVFGTRLELRLGDPIDSEVDRRLAATVPAGRPGRGLVSDRLHFLAALPRIDADPRAETLPEGIEDLVARVRAGWRGPQPPKLRLLPARVGLEQVRDLAGVTASSRQPDTGPGGPLLLGLDEKELAPVSLETDAEPHLLVLGDGQSGKTGLLRTLIHEVRRTRGPRRAQLVLVDYRRSLLGEVPEEHLLDHLTSATQATAALLDLATHLRRRLPGPDVTAEQLRSRSWWSGPEVFVLVDDYDLVSTREGSPLDVLQPLLGQARDVGLHLVVTRRTGGASRAMYEPVLQTLRDLAVPTLLLSGSPDEGPLAGDLRAAPAPAGRARLLSRGRGLDVVQLAWTEPAP